MQGDLMAEIQAFRAFRYDLGRVGNLSNVIAPPYDVIDPGLQDVLYERSPYNVVRLILNKETVEDSEANNRYTRSAQVLRDWQRDGVLVQDSARAFYVYHQEFQIEGKSYIRRGFMARVRLERLGEGRIYAHEATLSGPKEDRLKLFRATAMNLSQIFGLYPDEAGAVQAQLDAAVGRSLPLQATDHLGVVHRLWPITDQRVISTVTGLMGSKPIFIADGHHRYETGLRYLEEKRKAGEVTGPESAANFILMMLVSMNDPGLVILPTHRLISGLGDLTAQQLGGLLARDFDIEFVGEGAKGARDAWELIEASSDKTALGLGTVVDGRWLIARFHSPALMAELAPKQSKAWRGLAVSILHKVLLEKLLAGTATQCRYVHLLSEVLDAIQARQCQLAALVPPATMHDVEQIAGNLEKMPPKSTYFYPKLLSGLVFHSLKGN
jgi:uncharacterized protein (DUF1015 family)